MAKSPFDCSPKRTRVVTGSAGCRSIEKLSRSQPAPGLVLEGWDPTPAPAITARAWDSIEAEIRAAARFGGEISVAAATPPRRYREVLVTVP
jgi:hypothetical protein